MVRLGWIDIYDTGYAISGLDWRSDAVGFLCMLHSIRILVVIGVKARRVFIRTHVF